jgi:hypothetical protein
MQGLFALRDNLPEKVHSDFSDKAQPQRLYGCGVCLARKLHWLRNVRKNVP